MTTLENTRHERLHLNWIELGRVGSSWVGLRVGVSDARWRHRGQIGCGFGLFHFSFSFSFSDSFFFFYQALDETAPGLSQFLEVAEHL